MADPASPLKSGDPFKVVIPVFPGVTHLDFAGPLEVLTRVRGVSVELAWKDTAPVACSALTPPAFRVLPTIAFADVGAVDLLCVPGGPGHVDLLGDPELLAFLRRTAATARYVTAVCTGSLLLGAAGLLRGYRATTHWASLSHLAAFGAVPTESRVVVDRNRITGGGVSAGIDFALQVIRDLWGERTAQRVQLSIEYDPQPPVQAGTPRTAPSDIVDELRAMMQGYADRQRAAVDAARQRLDAGE
jgi:cyclohexyl-isocyanide hydratase